MSDKAISSLVDDESSDSRAWSDQFRAALGVIFNVDQTRCSDLTGQPQEMRILVPSNRHRHSKPALMTICIADDGCHAKSFRVVYLAKESVICCSLEIQRTAWLSAEEATANSSNNTNKAMRWPMSVNQAKTSMSCSTRIDEAVETLTTQSSRSKCTVTFSDKPMVNLNQNGAFRRLQCSVGAIESKSPDAVSMSVRSI
jgi:predicted pyridoxine 5'-phosphate oxidase superfamily flavin-nucleotide-binding protein